MGMYISFEKASASKFSKRDEISVITSINNNIEPSEELKLFLKNNPNLLYHKLPKIEYSLDKDSVEQCHEMPLLIAINNRDFSHPLLNIKEINKLNPQKYHLPRLEVNLDKTKIMLGVKGDYLLYSFQMDKYDTKVTLITNANRNKMHDKKPYTTITCRMDTWEGYKLYDILSPLLGYTENYAVNSKWDALFNSIPSGIPSLFDGNSYECFSKDRVILYTPYVKKDKLEQWNKGINEWDETSYISYG